MIDISNYLIGLADRFDQNGQLECANAADSLLQTGALQKVAQYVGAIGYVLKQERAMANCIRRKRVQAKSSMQEVILDCLKEYQNGQTYNDTEWTSKYAEVVKTEPTLFKKAASTLIDAVRVENSIDDHINTVIKAAQTFDKFNTSDPLVDKILNDLSQLAEVLSKEDPMPPFRVAMAVPNERKWYHTVGDLVGKAFPSIQNVKNRMNSRDAAAMINQARGLMNRVRQMSVNYQTQRQQITNFIPLLNASKDKNAKSGAKILGSLNWDNPALLQQALNQALNVISTPVAGGSPPAVDTGALSQAVNGISTALQGVPNLINQISPIVASLGQQQGIVNGEKTGTQEHGLVMLQKLTQNVQALTSNPFDQQLQNAVDFSLAQLLHRVMNPKQQGFKDPAGAPAGTPAATTPGAPAGTPATTPPGTPPGTPAKGGLKYDPKKLIPAIQALNLPSGSVGRILTVLDKTLPPDVKRMFQELANAKL